MRSVTEFPSFKLLQAVQTKTALAAEGKTPEEIQANFGETYKLEGDKLKYFTGAVEVASQNADKLYRVLVVTLNEGETVPPKAVKLEEHYYIPEFMVTKAATAPAAEKEAKGGRDGGKGGGKGGPRRDGGGGKPKSSPWGISPEEKEAKLAASRKAQSEKSKAAKA